MRRQVPPEKTKDVLEFATMKPADRLASIERGLRVRTLYFFSLLPYHMFTVLN